MIYAPDPIIFYGVAPGNRDMIWIECEDGTFYSPNGGRDGMTLRYLEHDEAAGYVKRVCRHDKMININKTRTMTIPQMLSIAMAYLLVLSVVELWQDDVMYGLICLGTCLLIAVYLNHFHAKKQDPPQDQPSNFVCYEKYKVDSRTCRWQCSECRYKQYLDERYNNTL